MLRTFLQNHSPTWIVRLLQEALHSVRRQSPVDILPFDALFEDVEKRYYQMPRPVEMPEIRDIELLEDARYLKGQIYAVPEDYVAEIDDVLFCPNNNVLMTDRQEVIGESLNTGGAPSLMIRDFYLHKTEYLPGYSTPLRSRHSNYYHMLIDCIPRLMAFDRPPYDELDQIQLLCPGGIRPVEEFLVEHFGPDNLQVVTPSENVLYRLEKTLFTPFKTRKFSGYLPEFYRDRYREQLLPDRPSRQKHRIFVSREKTYTRKIENRDQLRGHLQEMGFETIMLERLPLREQIELFYDAEVVVGAHGSGLTNMLFSPNLKVLELFPTRYVIPHYFYLSRSLGHDYNYWCGPHEYRNIRSFEVDTSRVVEMLGEMNLTATSVTV